jgi:hypothetical protein
VVVAATSPAQGGASAEPHSGETPERSFAFLLASQLIDLKLLAMEAELLAESSGRHS